jgi:hypothetical protein
MQCACMHERQHAERNGRAKRPLQLREHDRRRLRSDRAVMRIASGSRAKRQSRRPVAHATALADLKQAQADLAAANGNTSAQREAEPVLASERAKHAQHSQQLAKCKSSYEDLRAVSRSQDAQRKQVQTDLKARETQLQRCEVKNAQLNKVGHDILDAYERIGLGTVLKTRQPFAQSARELRRDRPAVRRRSVRGRMRSECVADGCGGTGSGCETRRSRTRRTIRRRSRQPNTQDTL